MKVNLEQLEEMQKELFKQQCDLDIQKAMVKHFIKKEKDKQLTLTDVVKRYRVEAISFNKKHLHNVVVESIEEAEKLYQDLKIKYYQTYTNITMTEL